MGLLSINGLCHTVGVPQNTVIHWIEDFNFYIPETHFQNVTYYHTDAIDVLKFIKRYKDKGYQKTQIMYMLENSVFPIPVKKTVEGEQQTLNSENYRENILTVMQTLGKTVTNVSDQKESIMDIQEQQNQHKKRIKNTEKQMEEISELKQEIELLKQEIESLKQEPPLAKEYEMKKESFAKLFDK
ncbi:MerR family transcriptional regulator [Virgibacillus siamensis]|uniref:MerR family transcriptional regulator n=1 Tax=Virgibacillus siamensis TaxID=480071 RepID=UPI001589976D|nr:MerR family transcriptional regulator [Virgibacillus siamensis]